MPAAVVSPWYRDAINSATSFLDIAEVFRKVFGLKQNDIPGQEPPATPTDYKGENTDFGLKVKGIKAREEINEQCKDILSRVHSSGDLTGKERDILKQYSGKGGLTQNSQFEYYTPTHVAEGVWDALAANGYANGNVLEPSTGAGVFSATKPKGSLITGTEIDPVASKINQLLHPEDLIKNQSFEKLAVEALDHSFDAIIGNVPFGDARGASIHDDPAYKSEKRIERYFLLRALDKVKPGGLVCFVVPTNIVGNKGKDWEKFRIACSKKAEFLGAHKLPSKTFAAQGTDTVVDVVVFKKHPPDLLDKIDDLPFETLKSTQVVWNEFVSGQYWQGEGRQFIMGKYVPKTPGDRWSREVVDGDMDNEGIKRKLAQKFSSRIDWNALEIAEPIVKNYANGDRKFINGQEYEMSDNHWSKVIQEKESIVALDPEKFGVSSLQDLKAKLATPETTLDLLAENVFNIYKQYPDILSPLQKQAIEFAMSQPKTKYHEQIFRGSIIGGLLGRYQNKIAEGINESAELAYLQELVTKEIDRYGHPLNNKKLLLTGASSKMFGLFINSIDEKGNFSDLLSGTITQAGNALQYDSANLQSIVEHLAVREGFMEMELEDIQKLYTGKQEIKSLGDLAHEDNIAITPDGMIMPISRYCAGDIYPKLVAMTQAMATEQDDRLIAKYQKQIDEINLRRKVTPAEDIIFGLQQKWYGRKYIVDFLRENGYPSLRYGRTQTVKEQDPLSGKTETSLKWVEDYDDPFGTFTFGGKLDGFDKQFIDYLNGGKVTSSKAENIEAYKQNVKIIEDRFNAWMQQHPEIDQVADAFNVKFNGYVPFEYGGEPLGLKEVSPQVKLHDYQNASIRRLSEEGRGILAHDVGLGKTFQALGLFAYNKQMGRSKKTCIVVPKAVLANWYHESKMFLDNHHDVLFVGFDPKMAGDKPVQEVVKDEFGNPKKNKYTGQVEYQDVLVADSPQEVYEKMWKIPQTNLSLVVMTKEKFGAIPMRAASKLKYTDKMVGKQLVSDKLALSVLTGDDKPDLGKGQNKISYDEAKQMDRYRQIYSDEGTSKKGEFPYYEDMGFDAVIVDEMHEFKNSFEGGKETGQVAYLPTAPAAQRAVDMAMKMDYLRANNGGRGAYGLTATPVTNSPFEIFNMLGLVCDVSDFERFGVYTVDDFIRVFGKIEPVDKVKVSTEVVTRDGLTGFQNLDGLRNLFHKYVNMKDAKDVNLPLPPATEQHEEVEMTPEQQTLYEELREEAKEASKPGSGISMFSVIRNMDRVTTDMDLYKHTMTFVFPGAGKAGVEKLLASLPESISITRMPTPEEELAGVTGMVKTSVPLRIERQEENGNYVVAVPEYYEESVVSKFKLFGIDSKDVSHPIMPKYAQMIENIKKEYEGSGKQLVFTEEKSQHQKIKRIIVHHVPMLEDKIGVINADTADGAKLQQISDSYNTGGYILVIANKKAEVGVNLQKGTTAIHHLTLPWTPASIQQRNGRGIRQGNPAEHINVYYYMGRGSFDGFRLDLLQKKSNWMRDLFDGKEATADNANAFNGDDFIDMLEANPEEAKKRRLERLAKKQAERQAREDKVWINTLAQLSNVTYQLNNLDAAKESSREAIAAKISDSQRKIENLEYRKGNIAPENADKHQAKIDEEKKYLASLQQKDSNLDADFAGTKANLEAKVQKTAGLLKGRAKKNELPFDPALIDKPDQALVTFGGRIIAISDCYEAKEDIRDSNGSIREGTIVKITEVDIPKRLFKCETLTGWENLKHADGKYGWHSSDLFTNKALVQVSYSEKEIALKKILSEEMTYQSLIDGTIDRDTFREHLSQIRFSQYGDCVMEIGGEIVFDSCETDEKKMSIVYPEIDNEDFRKRVAEKYLEIYRDSSALGLITRSTKQLMGLIFGSAWHTTILSYGKTATESEVRAVLADAWQAIIKEAQDVLKLDVTNLTVLRDLTGPGNRSKMQSKATALGDNVDEIRSIAASFFTTLQEDINTKIRDRQDEADRQAKAKAQEDAKKDPNYKEIPADVDVAFKKLGLTAKYNLTRMTLPGFKGRKGEVIEPFGRLFLQDSRGKNGSLFRVKEILKARYQAKFFADAGDGFMGAWWHVPGNTEVAELYKLLS